MKKLYFLIAFVLCALCFVACNQGDSASDVTTTGADVGENGGKLCFMENGQSDYVIIFPRGDVEIDAAYRFASLVESLTGKKLKSSRDGTVAADDTAKEIVIGETDREDFCAIDRTSLIADAFAVKVAGERIFISAVSADGYEAAFGFIFKEMFGIGDLNDMKKTENVSAYLPRELEHFGAPAGQSEENKTESGLSYTVSGETRKAYNYCEFSSALTYNFTDLGAAFNSYSLKYSSDTALRGVISYKKDGSAASEEFFLESGKNMEFTSLTDGALSGVTPSDVTKIELYVLGAKTSCFRLENITLEKRNVPTDETVYISDGNYKLGIRLTWGGGISYLEDLHDNDNTLTNLLNEHDTGRLVQQSYYGTNKAPYECGTYNGQTWGYNPVQGGDQHNNRSKLVDFKIDGSSVYVKCRPLDWAKNGSYTPSYMENTYTLCGGHIKVDNRFTDFSGYVHRSAHQELPAFYTVSYLSEFVCYTGKDAWQDGSLTVKSELPFWAGNADAYFDLGSEETWCAWRATDGYGVGVYTPIAEILLAGRHAYNGSKDAKNNATNYVAPLITTQLKSYEPFEYTYYITTGDTDSIRNTFKGIAEQ